MLVDIRDKKLQSQVTNFSTVCLEMRNLIYSFEVYFVEYEFLDMVENFSSFIQTQAFSTSCKHLTVHFIETKRPLVLERPW